MKVYHNRFIEKQTSLIGNIAFLVLAIMAIVFWRERTIMLDASFQSFDVINKGKLAIQVQRFGAAFVQMFPLLTSKLGLPLKAILISYSLSFIIFHYLMFLICNYILKIKEMIPENNLRGTFILEGENANIEVNFTLSPEKPALIQEYNIKEILK